MKAYSQIIVAITFLSCVIEALTWFEFINTHSPEDTHLAMPNVRCISYITDIRVSLTTSPLSNSPLRIILTDCSSLSELKRQMAISHSALAQGIDLLDIPTTELDCASSSTRISLERSKFRTSVLCCPLVNIQTVSEGNPWTSADVSDCDFEPQLASSKKIIPQNITLSFISRVLTANLANIHQTAA